MANITDYILSTEPRIENLPRYFTFMVAALVAIGPFTIDTYLPAMPIMAKEFGVGIEQINFTIITYMLGYGSAQLIGGPLSDQIGRKKVAFFGLSIYIPCTLLIAMSDTILMVQILRAVQAFGGGFATVICMALIRDAYEPEEAARQFPKVIMIMLLAPLVAPMIGILLIGFGWPSIFVFLALYGLAMLVSVVRIPETAPNLTHKISFKGFVPQYKEVVTRRENGKLIPLLYILTIALSSGCLIVFISNVSFLYIINFAIDEKLFPLFFALNIGTMLFFTGVTSRLVKTVPSYLIFRVGLTGQLISLSVLVAIVTFANPSVWVFTVLMALTIGMTGLISPSVTALYMAHYERLAGSASSVLSVSIFMLGAILATLSQLFFDDSVRPIVYTMLVSVILSNLVATTIPAPIKPKLVEPQVS